MLMRIWSALVVFGLSAGFPAPFSAAEPAAEKPPAKPAPDEEGPVPEPLETEKGRGPHTENWEPYLELLEAKYLSPSAPEEAQAVHLKFNLSTDLVKGTVITFTLEYMGAPYVEMDYKLEGEVRKALVVRWKAPRRLVTGDYYLRTRILPERQTQAVLKQLRKMSKRFPPENEPWAYLYMKAGHIVVSGKAEEAADKEAICRAYTAFLDELVENMNEFVDKMESAKEGKDFVAADGKLDVEKMAQFIVEWRKKQGETQKKLIQFQDDEPGICLKSQTSYANLLELGRMVSKRSWQLQNEVTEKYGAKPINPAADKYFDRNYRFRVDAEALASRYERIASAVCPEEEPPSETVEETPAEGEAPGEMAPPEGEGGEQPAAEAAPPEEGEGG